MYAYSPLAPDITAMVKPVACHFDINLPGKAEASWSLELMGCGYSGLLVMELFIFQVNGAKKSSFMVPSDMCKSVNHSHLQVEAIKVALKQNIIESSESASKVFIAHNGNVVNFVVEK